MKTELKSLSRNVAWKAVSSVALAGALVLGGCNSNPHYPDQKDAVNNALTSHQLGAIHVAQDRDKGVMTLTGTVPSQDQKTEAESVAKQAAPTYTVADQIGVVPPVSQSDQSDIKAASSETDHAIEDEIKAAYHKHHTLRDNNIDVNSTNGSVKLSGNAKTAADKSEAEKLAKAVPHVKQVVNEITVKH